MAKPSDLTDAATLRAMRTIKATDERTELRIGLLISAMSNAVRRYCQREFLGKDLGEDYDPASTSTRRFRYDGRGYLSLAPYEAREITSVTMGGNELTSTDEAVVISGRYLAEPPERTPEGTFLYLTLPERRDCTERPALVAVTARWGIVDLPDDVELACVQAVSNAFDNPEGAASRTLDGITITNDNDDTGGSLPRSSRALLSDLRRRF